MSLETEGKTGGEREERSSEDNRVKKTRLSGVCSPHKSDGGNECFLLSSASHIAERSEALSRVAQTRKHK